VVDVHSLLAVRDGVSAASMVPLGVRKSQTFGDGCAVAYGLVEAELITNDWNRAGDQRVAAAKFLEDLGFQPTGEVTYDDINEVDYDHYSRRVGA